MPPRFSESELLAAIEGELTARQEAKLRARLEVDPETAVQIETMRVQRETLRTLDEPELPMDFLAELEPQLARPMLIESRPGAYRRRHQRKLRARRWARFAVAAGLLLVLLGGVWAAALQVMPILQPRNEQNLIADRGSNASVNPPHFDGSSATAPAPSFAEVMAASDVPLIHYAPLPLDPSHAVATGNDEADGGSGFAASGTPTFAALDFALVIEITGEAAAETVIQNAIASMTDSPNVLERAALVRNFSPHEARTMVARYFEPGTGASEAPGRVTSIDSTNRTAPPGDISAQRELAKALRSIQREHSDADAQLRSMQLVGPKGLAPDYEQQLAFAEAGAAYTITVRADELSKLLEALHQHDAQLRLLTLENLPQEKKRHVHSPATGSGASWIIDFHTARARIDELSPGAFVQLPVIVEHSGRP